MDEFYESKYLESTVALSADIGNENLSYHTNNNLYRSGWRCGGGSGHFFGSLENNILAARNDQFVNDITKSPAFHSSFLRHHDSLNSAAAASSLYGFDPLSMTSSSTAVSSTSSTQFFSNGQFSSPHSSIYSNIGLAPSSSSIGYAMDAKLLAGISQNNSSMYTSIPGNNLLSRYPNMAAMASFTQGNASYCLPNHNSNATPPSQVSSTASSNSMSPQQFSLPHSIQDQLNYDPRELEIFSEKFKQRRIKLGVTQADVGKALGNLKLNGVGSLSQSTICRFESLTLSHNNMVALKPILQAWLEEAERQATERMKNPDLYNESLDRKRKRTSITDAEKRSLEAYFAVQPRPSSEKIAQIADKLNLKKNVVRVWFCNQRQKQKRMKFSTVNIDHHSG